MLGDRDGKNTQLRSIKLKKLMAYNFLQKSNKQRGFWKIE